MKTLPRITLHRTGLADPGQEFFAMTVRFLGWRGLERIAAENDCTVTSKRVGLITKRFVVRGDLVDLERFINAMCLWDPDLRRKLGAGE